MQPELREQQLREYYDQCAGFCTVNQIRTVDLDDGKSVVEVALTERGCNPLGIAHGGLVFALCDVAAGTASRTSGRVTVTQNASIYYLAPGKDTKKLIARGTVIREGYRTGIVDVTVECDDGTLVAKSTVTVHYLNDDSI